MRPGRTKASIVGKGARTRSATGYQGQNLVQWGKGSVRDWVPSLVSHEMGPREGQGLAAKAGIECNGAWTGSGTG